MIIWALFIDFQSIWYGFLVWSFWWRMIYLVIILYRYNQIQALPNFFCMKFLLLLCATVVKFNQIKNIMKREDLCSTCRELTRNSQTCEKQNRENTCARQYLMVVWKISKVPLKKREIFGVLFRAPLFLGKWCRVAIYFLYKNHKKKKYKWLNCSIHWLTKKNYISNTLENYIALAPSYNLPKIHGFSS